MRCPRGLVLGLSFGLLNMLRNRIFQHSLPAEYSPHPGRALLQARLDLQSGGLGSAPGLAKHALLLFLGFRPLLCRMRSFGNFSVVLGSVVVRRWEDSDLLPLNTRPVGRSSYRAGKTGLESLHLRPDFTHNSPCDRGLFQSCL